MSLTATKPDDVPNHVAIEALHPAVKGYFFDWKKLGVRTSLKGDKFDVELTSVIEFNVSEGWYKSQVFQNGKPKKERGRYVYATHRRPFEVYWRIPK